MVAKEAAGATVPLPSRDASYESATSAAMSAKDEQIARLESKLEAMQSNQETTAKACAAPCCACGPSRASPACCSHASS